jgi:N-acetylglucosaminyl-diphospho-decaprenol L-rhamnosyltransferase
MADIGIIIVTYNSGDEIGPCLDAAMSRATDVVVVDNNSNDYTIAEVARRGARLIANSTNRGFAAAVNQGFAVLKNPYIVLLNPDAVLLTGLEPLSEASDLPRAAGAGGQLVDSQGLPQLGFMIRRFPSPAALVLESLLLNRIWPNNPVNRRYRALDLDPGKLGAVEQPAGAFLMIRREVWEKLGGFDERYYPLWFEDVDFCRRAADVGYLLYYAPAAVAKHTGGHSIPQISVELRRIYWYRSLLRYAARRFRPISFRTVSLAVIAGSALRAILESAGQRSLKPLAAWGRVVRLAGRCLLFGWRDEAV